MTTLHLYSNRHIKNQVKNIKANDWVYIQNSLSRNIWGLYFRSNTINEDDLNITYITQEEFFNLMNMRFDSIIGNPPYQDSGQKAKNNKLWHKFVEKSLALIKPGGAVTLLTPSTIVGVTGYSSKMTRLISSKYNCKLIDYTATHHFNVGVSICLSIIMNEPYQGSTRIIMDDVAFDHDLRTGTPLSESDKVKHSILNKISNSYHPRIQMTMGQGLANDDYCDSGQYEVYSSGQQIKRTNIQPTTSDALKFVIPFSSSYKNRFTTHGHIGMLNMWCHIDSEKEGARLSNILDVPLIQFYIENYKRTSGFTPAIKNSMLPDIDDQPLSNQFSLTDDEMGYLSDLGVAVT
jgi:hypothetical protein